MPASNAAPAVSSELTMPRQNGLTLKPAAPSASRSVSFGRDTRGDFMDIRRRPIKAMRDKLFRARKTRSRKQHVLPTGAFGSRCFRLPARTRVITQPDNPPLKRPPSTDRRSHLQLHRVGQVPVVNLHSIPLISEAPFTSLVWSGVRFLTVSFFNCKTLTFLLLAEGFFLDLVTN